MSTKPFSWTCPFCGQPTTVTETNYDEKSITLDTSKSAHPDNSLKTIAIRCPNQECDKLSLSAQLYKNGFVRNSNGIPSWTTIEIIQKWSLLPRSTAKPIPDYVPFEIRSNYLEACLIKNDSPKASAAMSRRCLQGIIRDYWKIPIAKRGNLGAEISYITDKVDSDTLGSIRAVREVGDIGAHMEKSVDSIVDVEPEEATLLVELIETLISDWYVARHRRAERNRALQETVMAKRDAKKIAKNQLKQNEEKSDES